MFKKAFLALSLLTSLWAAPARANLLMDDMLFGTASSCLSGGGSPVGIMDGLTPTAAWSASRKLFTAWGGAYYTLASGGSPGGIPYPTMDRATAIFDQSGNARDISPTSLFGAPLGCTNPTSFQFKDAWGTIEANGSMANFITSNDGYMIVSLIVNAGNTAGAAPCYPTMPIITESGSNSGITLQNWVSGVGGEFCFNNWDGGGKQVTIPGLINTPYVLEWRKESGVLYGRLNGGSEVSIAVGTTTTPGNFTLASRFLCCILDGYLFEVATFSTVPTLAQRNQLVYDMGTYINVDFGCAEHTAFMARTSGIDAAHDTAYKRLICGLVADGVWAKLDVLRIYATQDQTTALLNLKSTSYNATITGTVTFTTDRGFTGTAASTTNYINSNYNAFTAGGNYTQNASHISNWVISCVPDAPEFGVTNVGNTVKQYIWCRYSVDSNKYIALNGANNVTFGGPTGHTVAARPNSTTYRGYTNGAFDSLNTTYNADPVISLNFYEAGINIGGTANGSASQQAMVSIGGNLSDTDVANFYARLRTYMTTVGVP